MIYLRLFTAFIKIGFTSFGGMSMIPVIMQEMKVNQWMTAEDLTNLIAIAEMTPGPLGINCATFAGMQTAGVLGGIAAVMGVLMPAYTLTLGVAGRFWITDDCKSLQTAFSDAVWNKDVTDKDERLDDGSTDIDSLDAFEYTIERDMKDLIEEVEDV